MGTKIRPELSSKNKYWIEKHRYYELKHFCLQYPIWKAAYTSLTGLSQNSVGLEFLRNSSSLSDPTARCAEAKEYYLDRIEMLEKVAKQTDVGMWDYILKGVTEGVSYEKLKARLNIPCCKDVYYDLYRRFFWLLNKVRQ